MRLQLPVQGDAEYGTDVVIPSALVLADSGVPVTR
jgi:hypothetical protein